MRDKAVEALRRISKILEEGDLAALLIIGWTDDEETGFASSVIPDSSGAAYGWWMDVIAALDKAQEEHDRSRRDQDARWN